MTNVVSLRNTGGFTRMDNELYEALIGADLSGRELRVALAIHRLTAGFNKEAVKVAALYIAKMLYRDERKAEAERANVSRAINALIRQRVLYRAGGSRDPITFLPVSEWKIDDKSTVLKSTHCVENTPASVLKITHIKDSKEINTPNGVVDAVASTPSEPVAKIATQPEPPEQPAVNPDLPEPAEPSKTDRIPYEQIRELYNRILGGALPRRLGLDDKDRKRIRSAYNLKLNNQFVICDGGLEFWEGLFNDALECPFLLGQNPRNWRADFEFMTRGSSIQKFFEGKYDASRA